MAGNFAAYMGGIKLNYYDEPIARIQPILRFAGHVHFQNLVQEKGLRFRTPALLRASQPNQ